MVVSPKPILADGTFSCLGCSAKLVGQEVGCPQCTFPMCGRPQCWGEGSRHALGECGFLKAAGRKLTQTLALSVDKGLYESIVVLRCLGLRQRNVQQFGRLLELKFYFGPTTRVLKQLENEETTAAFVKLVNQIMKEKTLPEEWIQQFWGVFKVVSFRLPAIYGYFDGLGVTHLNLFILSYEFILFFISLSLFSGALFQG